VTFPDNLTVPNTQVTGLKSPLMFSKKVKTNDENCIDASLIRQDCGSSDLILEVVFREKKNILILSQK